ncbi:MAG TPA: hypothetical protein VJR92_10320 [Gemmatimonadaceae bacterium]|nr:hypothetical protein [Gemmatimonadaceae bacterium]
MMRAVANLIAFTLTLIITTVFVGWWTVPVVAFVWTLATPRRAAVIYAAFAGAMAWGALLSWMSRTAPIGAVDSLMAQIMDVPQRSIVMLTLAYAALLAGSAALVAQSIRPPVRTPRF